MTLIRRRHLLAVLGALLSVGLLVTVGTASAAPATTAGVKADYRFQGTRASTAAGAPALVDVGGTNTFATQSVDGSSARVLAFGTNHGVQLKLTTVIPSGSYTVVVLAKLKVVSGFERIVDVKHGTSDSGLYVDGGALHYYGGTSGAVGSSTPVKAGAWAQIVLTRNATSRVVKGYVNGIRQISFTDSAGVAVIDAAKTLIFFRDDTSGGVTGEASAGAVARIRVFNGPLTDAQVKALDRAAK